MNFFCLEVVAGIVVFLTVYKFLYGIGLVNANYKPNNRQQTRDQTNNRRKPLHEVTHANHDRRAICNVLYVVCVHQIILPLVLPWTAQPSALLTYPPSAQFHARRLLLILESGSRAVSALVSFAFMPFIRAQKESRRLPPFGWGAFNPGFPGFAAL
jgi:hypothetical protein